MCLKERPNSITKGSSLVSSYLRSIKSIVNELSLTVHPLGGLYLVIYAFNVLGPTFREFTTSIRTRDSLILFHEYYHKLIILSCFYSVRSVQTQHY